MELIHKYFPELTKHQEMLFLKLELLYHSWNKKINLISRKDIDNLYERHILHSLSIAFFFQFSKKTSVLDVGTGGGFPGIPLAILFPKTNFHLIDSIRKKTDVVNDIARTLELPNIKVSQLNIKNCQEQYHYVISRAVTSFPSFYQLAYKNVSKEHTSTKKNGIIYLKGGDIEDEIKEFPKIKVFSLNDVLEESFFETKKILYLPKY